MADGEMAWEDEFEGADEHIVGATGRIPWLVPLCGAAMIFCLAMVAVFFGAPN